MVKNSIKSVLLILLVFSGGAYGLSRDEERIIESLDAKESETLKIIAEKGNQQALQRRIRNFEAIIREYTGEEIQIFKIHLDQRQSPGVYLFGTNKNCKVTFHSPDDLDTALHGEGRERFGATVVCLGAR